MKRADFDARAALYSSLLTSPVPSELDGTQEELAQRIRDRIAAKAKPQEST
jgi:hypothetical protein